MVRIIHPPAPAGARRHAAIPSRFRRPTRRRAGRYSCRPCPRRARLAARRPAAVAPAGQCLRWAAIGKTSWETSRILGLSESTVNFHLRNACERLGVRGRRAAVAKALQEKLLDAFTASS